MDESYEAQGIVLYKNIFEIAPEALLLFSFKDEQNLYESAKLKKHGKGVMKIVESALFDLANQVQPLKDLGERHKSYNVFPAHYEIIG